MSLEAWSVQLHTGKDPHNLHATISDVWQLQSPQGLLSLSFLSQYARTAATIRKYVLLGTLPHVLGGNRLAESTAFPGLAWICCPNFVHVWVAEILYCRDQHSTYNLDNHLRTSQSWHLQTCLGTGNPFNAQAPQHPSASYGKTTEHGFRGNLKIVNPTIFDNSYLKHP